MFVSARYDRSQGWLVGENEVLLIPELREVMLDESLGVHAIAFIVLGCDPDSFLASVFTDENDRLRESAKCVYEGNEKEMEAVMCNKKVIKAISKYRTLCFTPSVKIRQQFQNGVKQAGDFLERIGGALTEENIKDYMGALTDMPKLLAAYSDMNTDKKEEVEEVKARVRGDKQLSYRAKKFKQRKNV